MYRESQHYLALIRFPTLWGLLYEYIDPQGMVVRTTATSIYEQSLAQSLPGTANPRD